MATATVTWSGTFVYRVEFSSFEAALGEQPSAVFPSNWFDSQYSGRLYPTSASFGGISPFLFEFLLGLDGRFDSSIESTATVSISLGGHSFSYELGPYSSTRQSYQTRITNEDFISSLYSDFLDTLEQDASVSYEVSITATADTTIRSSSDEQIVFSESEDHYPNTDYGIRFPSRDVSAGDHGIAIYDGFAYYINRIEDSSDLVSSASILDSTIRNQFFALDDAATPSAIAIDDGLCYITDSTARKVFVYELSDTGATRLPDRDFDLDEGNRAPVDIAVDGRFAYSVDRGVKEVFVYEISESGGVHRPERGFDLNLSNASNAIGIAISDGFTYVVDSSGAVTSYELTGSGASYSPARRFQVSLISLGGTLNGMDADGDFFYISVRGRVAGSALAFGASYPPKENWEFPVLAESEQHFLDIVSSHSESISIAEAQESERAFIGVVSEQSESISLTESDAKHFEDHALLPASFEQNFDVNWSENSFGNSLEIEPARFQLPETWVSNITSGPNSRYVSFRLQEGTDFIPLNQQANFAFHQAGEGFQADVTNAIYTITVDGEELSFNARGPFPFGLIIDESDGERITNFVEVFRGRRSLPSSIRIDLDSPPGETLRIEESSTQTLQSFRSADESIAVAESSDPILARSITDPRSERASLAEASSGLLIKASTDTVSVAEASARAIFHNPSESIRAGESASSESDLARNITDSALITSELAVDFQRGIPDSSSVIDVEDGESHFASKNINESIDLSDRLSAVRTFRRTSEDSALVDDSESHSRDRRLRESEGEGIGIVEAESHDIADMLVNNSSEGIGVTDAEAHRSSLRQWRDPRDWEGKPQVGAAEADRLGEQLEVYRYTFTDEISALLRETAVAKAQHEGELFVAEGENLVGVIDHEPGEDKAYRIEDGAITIVDRDEIVPLVFPTVQAWDLITGDRNGRPEVVTAPVQRPGDGTVPGRDDLWFLTLIDRTVVWRRRDGFVAFQRR